MIFFWNRTIKSGGKNVPVEWNSFISMLSSTREERNNHKG